MMPGMDGWTVLGERKDDPALADVPVIMVTMLDDRRPASRWAAEHLWPSRSTGSACAEVARYQAQRRERRGDRRAQRGARPPASRKREPPDGSSRGRKRPEPVSSSQPARADLIVLDLMMPEMDGCQFAAELRRPESVRGIPVIVITAMEFTREDRGALMVTCRGVDIQKGAQVSAEELERSRSATS